MFSDSINKVFQCCSVYLEFILGWLSIFYIRGSTPQSATSRETLPPYCGARVLAVSSISDTGHNRQVLGWAWAAYILWFPFYEFLVLMNNTSILSARMNRVGCFSKINEFLQFSQLMICWPFLRAAIQ